jgi:hypothetical protein
VLVFNIYHEGTVNVTGEYKSKRISETYEIKYGKKTTASLIF